jgi:hypothetical protein
LRKNYQHFAALDTANCPNWRADPASAMPEAMSETMPDCGYARLCSRNVLPFARRAV